MSKFQFSGKRVLVTGAGRGIGRECVVQLAAAGAKVVALSQTEANLKTLRQEVRSQPNIAMNSINVPAASGRQNTLH